MEKAYKFRIYPNKKQKEILAKTFGCCRFVYNHYLAKKIALYKTSNTTLTYNQCCSDLTQLKNELIWLKEADKFALQNSLKDLDNAYQKFFKEHSGFPKFKSKKTHKYSYRTSFTNNNIEFCNKHIKLPKLKMVKSEINRYRKEEYLMLLFHKNQVGSIMYHYAVPMSK